MSRKRSKPDLVAAAATGDMGAAISGEAGAAFKPTHLTLSGDPVEVFDGDPDKKGDCVMMRLEDGREFQYLRDDLRRIGDEKPEWKQTHIFHNVDHLSSPWARELDGKPVMLLQKEHPDRWRVQYLLGRSRMGILVCPKCLTPIEPEKPEWKPTHTYAGPHTGPNPIVEIEMLGRAHDPHYAHVRWKDGTEGKLNIDLLHPIVAANPAAQPTKAEPKIRLTLASSFVSLTSHQETLEHELGISPKMYPPGCELTLILTPAAFGLLVADNPIFQASPNRVRVLHAESATSTFFDLTRKGDAA
ncbi:hypothetical protein [Paracoccus litorisediminis]|uniref:Uncharacterized protein n=1 Tax=Paracoccus litorisediminis TaxID=2006130 RepID=A0A844HMK6_9RHOB|nr:hypothetical protein [Paracoccus litorisediminis]MTH61150.1 hypothetical protein [Paracoccus litorisediminis]